MQDDISCMTHVRSNHLQQCNLSILFAWLIIFLVGNIHKNMKCSLNRATPDVLLTVISASVK